MASVTYVTIIKLERLKYIYFLMSVHQIHMAAYQAISGHQSCYDDAEECQQIDAQRSKRNLMTEYL